MIGELIPAEASFQTVLTAIGSILFAEIENQYILSGNDPRYTAEVYTENHNAFEQFLLNPTSSIPGVINIHIDNMNYPKDRGSVVRSQTNEVIYNIDCYGSGVAKSTVGGHTPSSVMAANNVNNLIRLVKNILMASEYVNLGLQGLVLDRWVSSATRYQPIIDEKPCQHILAARLSLTVTMRETTPQPVPLVLSGWDLSINRADDGLIYALMSSD